MRPNLEYLKLIIRLLILLILLVMLFIISAFLYSAKYWPDVYNYINANITIKRIPTISELHPVIIDETDFTTEFYSTTDGSDYLEATTEDDDDFDLNFDDFMNDGADDKRRKRQIPVEEMKVDIDIFKPHYDYVFDFDINTQSFVNEHELNTTELNYFKIITKNDTLLTIKRNERPSVRIQNNNPADKIESVYPWIATVFVMDKDSKQFEYICDGVLLSKRVVLTAARCVIRANATVNVDNVLIILGKRSLQSTGDNEKVTRVISIKVHDSFISTEEKADNDLAIAVLAAPVEFNVDIQPAPLRIDHKSAAVSTVTTGWQIGGSLQPIYLGLQSTEKCKMDANCNKLICATMSDSETTCPSYGGLLVQRHSNDHWRLKGIASGNPTNMGLCFNRHLTFTNIDNYLDWIEKYILMSYLF
ncbi:chymotrypsin-like elastase family member 2A isoform X2 [Leguminivora glycinivorella]|uniref:chymotrypsin-like elastase family member 2A isoform X2 n=1 Tax=Leguminivora glycinivorella TaxID=1035111 RepID=UPI00200C487D|nr:chymotrypsin-like elastase family member 2A isoform X2 [Leguminivora glycinivorella]